MLYMSCLVLFLLFSVQGVISIVTYSNLDNDITKNTSTILYSINNINSFDNNSNIVVSPSVSRIISIFNIDNEKKFKAASLLNITYSTIESISPMEYIDNIKSINVQFKELSIKGSYLGEAPIMTNVQIYKSCENSSNVPCESIYSCDIPAIPYVDSIGKQTWGTEKNSYLWKWNNTNLPIMNLIGLDKNIFYYMSISFKQTKNPFDSPTQHPKQWVFVECVDSFTELGWFILDTQNILAIPDYNTSVNDPNKWRNIDDIKPFISIPKDCDNIAYNITLIATISATDKVMDIEKESHSTIMENLADYFNSNRLAFILLFIFVSFGVIGLASISIISKVKKERNKRLKDQSLDQKPGGVAFWLTGRNIYGYSESVINVETLDGRDATNVTDIERQMTHQQRNLWKIKNGKIIKPESFYIDPEDRTNESIEMVTFHTGNTVKVYDIKKKNPLIEEYSEEDGSKNSNVYSDDSLIIHEHEE
jgi:hypothetical protein